MTKVDVERIKEKLNIGFTRFAFARNRVGETIPIDDEAAVCFCVIGACVKTGLAGVEDYFTYGAKNSPILTELNRAAKNKYDINPSYEGIEISYVNDYYGKDAVFEILDNLVKE